MKKTFVAVARRAWPRCRSSPRTSCTCTTGTTTSPPETVKRFEDLCKCEVVQTYYSDNEELLAKLAAGAKGYDVLVPTGNAVQALIRGQAAEARSTSRSCPISRTSIRSSSTRGSTRATPISVPYAMSTTILGYNDEKMKELGLPTDTWAVIFDPKHLAKLKAGSRCSTAPARALRRRAQVPGLLGERHRREALEGGRRRHQEGEAVLGGVQRVFVHQGAHGRQHLARPRLLERHLPGESRRAGGRAQVPHPAGRCRRKARCSRRQHGHPQGRAARRTSAPSSSTSC